MHSHPLASSKKFAGIAWKSIENSEWENEKVTENVLKQNCIGSD